jgi:hypothetical protein
LCTVLAGLVFAAINLGSSELEASVSHPTVIIAGFVSMGMLLSALLAALIVVYPFPNRYRPASLSDQKTLYQKLIGRKANALAAAVLFFGVGMIAFVVVIFTILAYR